MESNRWRILLSQTNFSGVDFLLSFSQPPLIQQICILWMMDALILPYNTKDLADSSTFKHSTYHQSPLKATSCSLVTEQRQIKPPEK